MTNKKTDSILNESRKIEIENLIDRFGGKLKQALTTLRDGLAKETDETKEMLDIYFRYTNGKADEKEIAKANQQFRDLMKALGLGVFLVLPAAPLTIPFFVKLAKRYDIDIIPSSFQPEKKPKKAEDKR